MPVREPVPAILLVVAMCAAMSALARPAGEPALVADGKPRPMFAKAFEVIRKGMVTNSAYGFTAPFFAPGANYGRNWWQIDSSSALEAWKWRDFEFSVRAMRNFLGVQRPDGRIPLWGRDATPKSPNHSRQTEGVSSLPVVFRTARDLAAMKNDPAFTREMFGMCSRYLDWWLSARLDGRTGLVSSVFEETFPPHLGCCGEFAGVDTGVMVALGAEWTAELADRLGEKDAAAARRRQSQSIFAAMRARMWDDAAGTFRPFDLKTGERGFESAEGFYMFADRALSPDVRRKLLASLTGPRFGWARIPLTSMAVDSPCYTNTVGRKYAFNASWSGNVWTLVNRWTVHGLLRSGCALEAVGLARATVGLIDGAGTFDEFYSPVDGSAQGGFDYVWTAAHYAVLVLEDLLGVSYDGAAGGLSVKPRVDCDFRIENLALPDGRTVCIDRTGGRTTLTTTKEK